MGKSKIKKYKIKINKKARDDFEECYQIKKTPEAIVNLARAFNTCDQHKQAARLLKEGHELFPDSNAVQRELALQGCFPVREWVDTIHQSIKEQNLPMASRQVDDLLMMNANCVHGIFLR